MSKIFTAAMLLFTTLTFAQTGTIEGTLTDKDANGEPLPFANVIIKGTTKGTTTDFDGKYIIENVPVGDYIIEFSFVGYETLEIPNVSVETDKFTRIDAALGASAAALDEVFITVQTSRERETALLLEQKDAVAVVESIGAQQMGKLGVSDASAATTKISGVSKTDGSGDVFVRGLGDRYLTTTLNGLPIPSDDIERKNIGLELFNTRLIQSIGVSKTMSPNLSADQASGNINITSKELSGSSELSARVRSGINTNVIQNGVFDNYKVSANDNDVTAGIYVKDISTGRAITEQTWAPQTANLPIDNSVSFSIGKKLGERFKVLFTAGQNSSYEYRDGEFRQFRSNFIDDSIPDAITWNKEVTTSGMFTTKFKADDNNDLKLTALVINKVTDQVFEGGREGTASIFEETDEGEAFQFIRDQNLKKTLVSVTQLSGDHEISEMNTLTWAGGYNYLSADEPNRIRNEVNFNFTDPDRAGLVQLGRTGGFQQRKSVQKIEDIEYNGRIADLIKIYDTDTNKFSINFGGDYRKKTRDFASRFYGVEETVINAVNPESIDQISEIFTQENFDNNLLKLNVQDPDFYDGTLQSVAGFANFAGQLGKFSVAAGLRFQKDDIDVNFDVGNFAGRTGSSIKDYRRLYPSLNLKYEINDKHSIRFANSTTRTLPEFKEIAPFEYVSPQGQITRGNTEVEASTNYNYDLKWEFFPSNDQLVSLTAFYKEIEDPINKVQDRGSAGIFSYFNSGEQAEIYGVEVETRVNLLSGDEQPKLRLNLNAARLWHSQDLKDVFDEDGNLVRSFKYNNRTEADLQGASDWIVNTSLNYETNQEFPLDASLVANYASDRVFALGAAEIQSSSDINYNEEIVENGFVTLDAIVSKELNENWTIGLRARNILNPEIKRTQLVRPSTTGIEREETVLSYTKGVRLGLNINYSF
ncbi:MAG: TonB-dependent receptor [Flavobacteriaceae bacterium]|nr:TonB-dependent receptor [Flavobacteriaceae bacterium]|tara:strand:- start:154157 stop:156943 length:2787 start_codon:yes stop_codon:yes gene_type:complete